MEKQLGKSTSSTASRGLLAGLCGAAAILCPLDVAFASNDQGAVVAAPQQNRGSAAPLNQIDVFDGRDHQIRVTESDAEIGSVVRAHQAAHLDGMSMPATRRGKGAASPKREPHLLDPSGASAEIGDAAPPSGVTVPRPEDEVCTLNAGRAVDCLGSELGGASRDDETDRAKKAHEERYGKIDLLENQPRPADVIATDNLFDRSPLGAQIAIALILGFCTCGLIPVGLIMLGSRHLSRQMAATAIIGVAIAGSLSGLYILYG